jgi:hypothetical protein
MCRSENATLKKLRKQQEQALAEVVSQKEEVLKWAAEEKMRTAKWCDEQQQLAVRERNAAAKMVSSATVSLRVAPEASNLTVLYCFMLLLQARDTRQKAMGGTVPIRYVLPAMHRVRVFYVYVTPSLLSPQEGEGGDRGASGHRGEDEGGSRAGGQKVEADREQVQPGKAVWQLFLPFTIHLCMGCFCAGCTD